MQMHAQIGGKLAQLGVRLIDSTAKKLDGEETRRRVLRVIGEAVGNTASAIV
jgi:carbon monoxide dehydrogenase subunit G